MPKGLSVKRVLLIKALPMVSLTPTGLLVKLLSVMVLAPAEWLTW